MSTKIAIATGIIIRQSAFVYMLINFTLRIFIDNVMSPVTMNSFLTFSQTARLATMQDFFTFLYDDSKVMQKSTKAASVAVNRK